MDLFTGMEVFTTAVEAESFADAARQLGVARSVVTKRIAQLEEHFGVALFHRSARTARLSEAGLIYYSECRAILDQARRLKGSDADRSLLSGTLRIHVLSGFARDEFARALMDFRRVHPEIRFDVAVNDQVIDPVKRGFDVALQAFPAKSDLLIERPIMPLTNVLVASPSYLQGRPVPRTPTDLKQLELGSYLCFSENQSWPLLNAEGCHDITFEPALSTNSVHLLLEFARSGQGVACLPGIVVEDYLADGRLVRVLEDYSAPTLWLSAVYPQSHRSTAKVKAFVDFLRARYMADAEQTSKAAARLVHADFAKSASRAA